MHKYILRSLYNLLWLSLLIGCVPNAARIQGRVTKDGQPTQEGYVTFRRIDQDKPPFILNLNIENGQYDTKTNGTSLLFGNYEVRVAITKKTGRQIPLPGAPNGQMQDEIITVSSAEYSSPRSPLKYEHKAAGTYDINVPSK